MENIISISYVGYLDGKKLKTVLDSLFGADNVKRELGIKVGKRSFRWDYVVNGNLMVEFDGPRHYQQASVQIRDCIKDSVISGDSRIVRIPYWVQLDKIMVKHFFGKHVPQEIELSSTVMYPHGFIDKNAPTPSDYNTYGLYKFKRELDLLPSSVRSDVIKTMRRQIKYATTLLNDCSLEIKSYPEITTMIDQLTKIFNKIDLL